MYGPRQKALSLLKYAKRGPTLLLSHFVFGNGIEALYQGDMLRDPFDYQWRSGIEILLEIFEADKAPRALRRTFSPGVAQ